MRDLALLAALGLVACSSQPGAGETAASDASSGSGTEAESGPDPDTSDTQEIPDIPDCTPGAFGCICAEGDTCSPDLACVDGMCTFSDCTIGVQGCACGEGDACNEGLFCFQETCVSCMPGTSGCDCLDGACDEGLSCINDGCWLASPYPSCGWVSQGWYYCAPPPTVENPDFPIECPLDLVAEMPCPPELTYEGCCDDTGTWWCENGVIKFVAC
jgi:hypothetical protein